MILTKSSLKLAFLSLFCKTPSTCGTNHKEQAILTKPIGYSTLTNSYVFTNDYRPECIHIPFNCNYSAKRALIFQVVVTMFGKHST